MLLRERDLLFSLAMKLALISLLLAACATAQTEKLRNERVVVIEDRLAPGESRQVSGERPGVTVYSTPGSIGGSTVKAGNAIFEAARSRTIQNTGAGEIKFVRVEFAGPGIAETWGATGLSPNYKVLLENRFTRVYDIRIPAGTKEPQHTHRDRVVICLSGAQLEHILPDGRLEPSTLATGDVAWRRGATHIGHNLGTTNLWVIAVEPK